jgi:hypothetical protein
VSLHYSDIVFEGCDISDNRNPDAENKAVFIDADEGGSSVTLRNTRVSRDGYADYFAGKVTVVREGENTFD